MLKSIAASDTTSISMPGIKAKKLQSAEVPVDQVVEVASLPKRSAKQAVPGDARAFYYHLSDAVHSAGDRGPKAFIMDEK